MKKIYLIFGYVIYIILKPIIYLLLNKSKRNRVAIIYKDQVLMVKSLISDNKWGFPGGGIKKNEDHILAVKREVYEETGISLNDVNIAKISDQEFKYLFIKIFLIFYKIKLKSKPKVSIIKKFEVIDAKWFRINDLINNPKMIEDQSIYFIEQLKD